MEAHNTHSLHESLDVFDDEFAVDDFDVVADGFAPGRVQNEAADDSDGEEPPVRSVAAHMADAPTTSTPTMSRFGGNRSSIRKSREVQNPFRSVEDEDIRSASGRTPSIRSQSTAYAPGNYHRSLSSTSSRPFAPSPSPVQASSGPSHPYAMYPQGTNVARTMSVSTVSTIRPPQRPLMADQGPTHPYGMYPQNVSEDVDEPEEHSTTHAQNHIPVGFPGRTQAFHRQQGPEGEEHDIIGVDGHTEQLPPYSEYPEDGVPKHIVLPGQTAASGTQLNVPLMPGRPQSMSDAGARASQAAFANMEQMESNESIPPTPKRWRDKSWKEKRKTKFCGIPFWWLLLSLCVVAFIAIVLGGAIGGFMSSQKHGEKHGQERLPSSTSLFDASPIPTSSTGSPPPTGTYALSLGDAEATQTACLTNQTYKSAWSCNIPGPPALAISIEAPTGDSSGSEGASLFDTSDYESYTNFSYGTQTPSTSFSQFIAVSDNDDLDRGPAFYFQAYYDKLVIVPQDDLPASTQNNKRDSGPNLNPAWFTRQEIAAGEKPWFCYWNGTMLEGFIYANQSTGGSSSSAASSIITSSPTPAPTSSSTYFTTTVSGLSTTATLTAASATSASPLASSNTNAERVSDTDDYSQLPSFGYVVKIEERRIQNSPAPYCQLMQILDDGTAGIVSDSNGNPIKITLGETDPAASAYQSSSSSSSSSSNKRSDTVSGGCHCQWWSGA